MFDRISNYTNLKKDLYSHIFATFIDFDQKILTVIYLLMSFFNRIQILPNETG